MFSGMIAACGLDCSVCPARLAWSGNDQALREKTAKEWTIAFGFSFSPEMINCSGCLEAEGPKVGYCRECKIRACAGSKGFRTCAECPLLETCGDLKSFHANVPEAKANLEALKG